METTNYNQKINKPFDLQEFRIIVQQLTDKAEESSSELLELIRRINSKSAVGK
jgi:hypothetical protein